MGFAPPIYLPAMEDSCNKILVKKECVSSSSSVSGQTLPMSQSDFHREKRQVRAEIVRCKRAGVACDDELMMKKRKLDEYCTTFFPAVVQLSPTLSTSQVEMDANKIRQLRNRESAERSRLKKDILVDTLTYQVLQCKLQLSDLKDENQWLREQKMVSTGCCASPYSSSGSTVSSGVTTCDEAEFSDSEDGSSYSAAASSNVSCSSPMANMHMYHVSHPSYTPPAPAMMMMMMMPASQFNCFGGPTFSYSSPVSGYSSPSDEDELLDDCADIIDSWFMEEGQLTL